MKENGHFAAKENAADDTRVIRRLIWSLVPAQASATTFTLINALANNVIVGRYFGSEALATIGFVGPLTMLGNAVNSLLSTGSSIRLCQ